MSIRFKTRNLGKYKYNSIYSSSAIKERDKKTDSQHKNKQFHTRFLRSNISLALSYKQLAL